MLMHEKTCVIPIIFCLEDMHDPFVIKFVILACWIEDKYGKFKMVMCT